MHQNNHQASFYRLAHLTAELARRKCEWVWLADKALRLRSTANFWASASQIFRDPRTIDFEPLTNWQTDKLLEEIIFHINSMVLSVPNCNQDINIQLANMIYRINEIKQR